MSITMISQFFLRTKNVSKVFTTFQACMSAQSKKDFEAIETYNKLRKKPLADTYHHPSEIRIAKIYFDKVKEFRKRSEEGFEPSRLFMVWRVGSLVDRPIWEKEIMINLGLTSFKKKYAIVKNTPSNNKVLWTVKHLIRLKPITFPDGFPTEEDKYSTFLKQTGELVVASRLKVDPNELEKDPEVLKKRLDPRTIRENLRLKWAQGHPNFF